MAQRDEILRYLHDYLRIHEVRDYCPQGLQVEGVPEVGRVALGVTADLEFMARAVDAGAQMLLVHHGLFWEGESRALVGMRRKRVHYLLSHDLNLVAYHLPLDRHEESGNNAQIAKKLGCKDLKPFGEIKGTAIGIQGRFDPPVDLKEIVRRVRSELAISEKALVAHGPESITAVGIVSGGGTRMVQEAIDRRLDLYVTGEIDFTTDAVCRESEMNYLALGHHDSERLGVLALGEILEKRFGVETVFVDLPNER